uniref:Nucleotide-diphospho-sugar transferase domain-containing protein n=1 Tax=Chromera velia CCMP2878 TaxID=1169474 RepID=A0A0G4I6L9_9ALVE|eukprot:Cvel_1914.t1-p1 / transcript=Cvel_1914.t1 / gene=Cvel_1914 / organism=Chromera_velia_CCMP2878 / gene_product=hypothetical protein / transcript_product=hypothetical protein / location=Cvel_scaffold71:140786-142903(+) / protein_length=551 / sequence_SO=supercontig / SO=protein_coding / is_pseudo=false
MSFILGTVQKTTSICAAASMRQIAAGLRRQATIVDVPDPRHLESKECPDNSLIHWEDFAAELFKARSLPFRGLLSASLDLHRDLLKLTVRDPRVGFACPLGVASVFLSLSQLMAGQGQLYAAQSLLHMGFSFIQKNRGFRDGHTAFPVRGWDMMLPAHSVKSVLDGRNAREWRDVPDGFRLEGGGKVGVVTVCAYPEGTPVRVLSEENHRLYCELTGCEVFFWGDSEGTHAHPFRSGRVPFWLKVQALQHVQQSQGVGKGFEWLMWADCDAFFTDPFRTIDSVIAKYDPAMATVKDGGVADDENAFDSAADEMRAGGTGQHVSSANEKEKESSKPRFFQETRAELLISDDTTGLNNGVFILRNSEWTERFLSDWWQAGQIFDASHNCSDQAAMQHILLSERAIASVDRGRIRSPPSPSPTQTIQPSLPPLPLFEDGSDVPVWPPEVRLVQQADLNSFHKDTAEFVLSREWRPGDFIKHHPGCHHYLEPCIRMYMHAADFFKERARALLDLLMQREREKKKESAHVSPSSPESPSCRSTRVEACQFIPEGKA